MRNSLKRPVHRPTRPRRPARAAMALALAVTTGAGAAAQGRYEVVNIPDMLDPGAAKVFILDTESGHMWTWSEEAATPGQPGGRFVIYQGQLRPGKLFGDVISSEQWSLPLGKED